MNIYKIYSSVQILSPQINFIIVIPNNTKALCSQKKNQINHYLSIKTIINPTKIHMKRKNYTLKVANGLIKINKSFWVMITLGKFFSRLKASLTYRLKVKMITKLLNKMQTKWMPSTTWKWSIRKNMRFPLETNY